MTRRMMLSPILATALCTFIALQGCVQPTKPPAEFPLTGQPTWFPLGKEIYHETEHREAEKEILALVMEPRWFLGYSREVTAREYDAYLETRRQQGDKFSIQETPDGKHYVPATPPYPKTLEDLPLVDHEVQLAMQAAATADPHIITLNLQLTSPDRTVYREVEHRWTNVLPFLFTFYIDGKAYPSPNEGFGKSGGMHQFIELVPSRGHRDWSIKVDADSLKKLLPDAKPHELAIVAAFSERQHEGHVSDGDLLKALHDDGESPHAGKDVDPETARQLLLRSNVARIRWTGTTWTTDAAP